MKKSFYAFAALLPLAAFAGCTKDDGNKDEHNASFKVVLLDATGETASVAVSSTGTDSDTWYCFCTSEVNSHAADLVSAEVSKLGGNVASVLKSGNRQVDFENLTPNTEYKAVVTGLLSDGTVYGTPVEVKFTTGRASGEIERNTDWNISFVRGMVSDVNFTISDFVSVEDKTDGKEKFFTMILPASEYPGDENIEAFIDDCVSYMQEMIDAYKLSWSDVLTSGNVADKYNLCAAGEWYAFAIGATEEGRRSGLWNRTDKVVIPAVTGSEDFMKYAGTWTYQYSDKKEGTVNVDFELIPAISETQNPENPAQTTGFYVVRGWHGSDENGPFFPDFTVAYQNSGQDPELDKKLTFISYDMEERVDLGNGVIGSLAVLGCELKGDELTGVVVGGFPAVLEVNGTTGTITGLPINTNEGVVNCNCVSIGALVGSNVSMANGAPMLPCTITKKAGASALAVKRFAATENLQPKKVSYRSMVANMSFAK